MPGIYNHTISVMGKQDGKNLYATDTVNWEVLAAAEGFNIKLSEHAFCPGEIKMAELRIENTAGEINDLIISFPINRRFDYIPETFYLEGHKDKTINVRYEGNSMYIEIPNDITIPAGETLIARFQNTTKEN